jgi:glycerol-3-phosphate acyltransferase PlsY
MPIKNLREITMGYITEILKTDHALWLLPCAYLLGSIPFGLILTKMVKGEDVRHTGSGNTGATNVLRVGGKGLALLTFLLDALKGYFAVWLAYEYAPSLGMCAAFLAMVGHIFPVWLNFKGGKGVAIYIGILFALHPHVGFVAIGIWLAIAIFAQISALASLIMVICIPFFILWYLSSFFFLAIILSLLVAISHRDNIQRLLKGTEPKIGHKE